VSAGPAAPRRVACLLAPDLPVAAEVRAEPALAGRPFAVVSEPGPRAVVLAASPTAARAGVQRGSPLAHARSVCAALRVRVASPARERAAREALLDVALSVSPRAALAPPRAGVRAAEAVVQIDASGCGLVFASEAALAGALVARAQGLGLPAVAALAGSQAVAELAARDVARREGPGATQVLAPGTEDAFLAPLSVDLLDLDDAVAELLTRFGIHRLGALLALPRAALATRLGGETAACLAPLRGEGGEPPLAAPRIDRLEEATDLEAPVDRLEPLAFVLHGLLSRLLERLAVRHLACAELELVLRLARAGAEDEEPLGPAAEEEPDARRAAVLSGGGRDVRRLRLAAPSRDPRTWLRRLRTALATDPPGAPVEGCLLAAFGCPPRRDQLDLFRPAGPAPAALDGLLAELEALCGPDRVGAPHVPDDPRPGAFAIVPFAPQVPGGGAGPDRCAGGGPPVLAIRALRPPLAAEVRLRAGRPVWIRSPLANGDVVHCAGPWRTTGGWWTEGRRFAFDAFDVATGDGQLFRLRYDHLRRTWEIDALYD
jgi:protein ImuB